jgi:hypothetical protein
MPRDRFLADRVVAQRAAVRVKQALADLLKKQE